MTGLNCLTETVCYVAIESGARRWAAAWREEFDAGIKTAILGVNDQFKQNKKLRKFGGWYSKAAANFM
jgi:hypothetical protein